MVRIKNQRRLSYSTLICELAITAHSQKCQQQTYAAWYPLSGRLQAKSGRALASKNCLQYYCKMFTFGCNFPVDWLQARDSRWKGTSHAKTSRTKWSCIIMANSAMKCCSSLAVHASGQELFKTLAELHNIFPQGSWLYCHSWHRGSILSSSSQFWQNGCMAGVSSRTFSAITSHEL